MLFNSIEFLFFLPVVFILYWFVFDKSLKWQNCLILFASYFFYAWWSYKFLGLLFLSTILDYLYGFGVNTANKKKAKLFLWLSVINNLGILAIFKYYNFFASELRDVFAQIGWHINPVILQIALPVGISFYTFHGMSYVFDIYRKKVKPVRSFIDYAVFVSFFPLLVAGPIERANHLLPQVQVKRVFNYPQAIAGCRLILWGLFKKVVIADSLAVVVDHIFTNYDSSSGSMLLVGAIAFSFQIYGDFSGYSDIAIGTAKLFGFELLSNFKFPYFSRDIAEFWRRWHISLSSWFRDYLYIPLGGSKEGRLKAVRNTFIIFLVSGFWHGASWNFIFWGFIHACGFLPLQLMNLNRKNVTTVVAEHRTFPSLVEIRQMAFTFLFVTLAWVFFRAPDIQTGFDYIFLMGSRFFQADEIALKSFAELLLYVIPLLILDWKFRRNEREVLAIKSPVLRNVIYLIMGLVLVYKFISLDKTTFIYFQF